jgi:hypothetical protein
MKISQPCTVRVLPSWPNTLPQRYSTKSPWLTSLWYLLGALVWNSILALFVWIAWIAPWRTRRVLKYGVPVAGQITSKTQIRGSKGGMSYQVKYVYQPTLEDQKGEVSNQLVDGQSYISAKDYTSATVGQIVTVLFDPRKPKRSLIYDFADYAAVE